MTVNERGEDRSDDRDTAIALASVREKMAEFRTEMVARQWKATAIVHVSAGEVQ